MDNIKARQLYELADRLSKIDETALSLEQVTERKRMITMLQGELSKLKEGSFNTDGSYNTSDDDANEFDEYEDDEDNKEDAPVSEQTDVIRTEAYERLYRVFDFSDFKG